MRELIYITMESLLGIVYKSWKLQNLNTRCRQTSPFKKTQTKPELIRHVGNILIMPAVEQSRQEGNIPGASIKSLGQLELV